MRRHTAKAPIFFAIVVLFWGWCMRVESHEIVYILLEWSPGDPIAAAFNTRRFAENATDASMRILPSPCRLGAGGPTFSFDGYYRAEADRIFAWLRAQGVDVPEPYSDWGDARE